MSIMIEYISSQKTLQTENEVSNSYKISIYLWTGEIWFFFSLFLANSESSRRLIRRSSPLTGNFLCSAVISNPFFVMSTILICQTNTFSARQTNSITLTSKFFVGAENHTCHTSHFEMIQTVLLCETNIWGIWWQTTVRLTKSSLCGRAMNVNGGFSADKSCVPIADKVRWPHSVWCSLVCKILPFSDQ